MVSLSLNGTEGQKNQSEHRLNTKTNTTCSPEDHFSPLALCVSCVTEAESFDYNLIQTSQLYLLDYFVFSLSF